MYIRCPHCDKIHQHGFNGNYQVEHYRAPHCENNESYSICFPLDGLYEIDQSRGLYVRAGVDPTTYFAQFDSVPPMDVSDQRKWTEAKEEVDLDDYHRNKLQLFGNAFGFGTIHEVERSNRLEIAVCDMICGRVQAVRSYLETSVEKDIFLHGVEATETRRPDIDEWDAYLNLGYDRRREHNPPEMKIVETTTRGVTALHMAACEMYPDMVRLLLDFGANPNTRTVDGRTPLMEAALWGRLDNVRHLISYGADMSVQCMRNGKRLRAVDFARETLENSEERYNRSGRDHQVYKEATHRRNMERAAIIRKLSDETTEEQPNLTSTLSFQSFAFTPILDGKSVISMLAHFDVPNKHKTIGILFRSNFINTSGFPPVAALSGWAHQPCLESNVQIAGKTWTDEVLKLCQIIGHNLPEDNYDQGECGQFHACHAEKQLIAYFVNKHLFVSHQLDMGDFGLAGLRLSESRSDGTHQDLLDELRKIQPPHRLRKAIVLVSRAVCDDCKVFVRKVNAAFKLDIELQGVKLHI